MNNERFWRNVFHGSLVLWVALLPLQTRWIAKQGMLAGGSWEYGTVSVYATDVFLALAACAYVVLRGTYGWKTQGRMAGSFGASCVALLVIAFLSVFTAHDSGVALNAWVRLGAGCAAWFLVSQSRVRMAIFAWMIVLSAGAESILAFVQFLSQHIAASTLFGIASHAPAIAGDSVVEVASGRFLRAYGTLPHPNMLAAWLVVGALCVLGLYLRESRKLFRLLLLTVSICIQTGLFLTFSRSAFVTWVVILCVITITSVIRGAQDRSLRHWMFKPRDGTTPESAKALTFFLASILITVSCAQIAMPLVQTRVLGGTRLERKSLDERLTQIDDATYLFRRHWLLGAGIGNYTLLLHDERDSTRDAATYQPVHMTPMLILVELGVLGWLVALWCVVVVGLRSLSVHRMLWKRSGNGSVPWIAVTGSMLLAILAMSFFDHFFWSLPFGIMFTWAVLGLWQRSVSEK